MTKLLSIIRLLAKRKVCHWLKGVMITLLLSLSAQANSLETSQVALQEMLAQHKGEVIYLDFWASWCLPCRKSFPWMNQMQRRYHEQGFAVISVNLDANEALAKAFLVNNIADFPVIYDPKGHIAQHFAIKGMPSSMLIGRQGKIRQSHSGFFNSKVKGYEAEIVSLLK